MIAASGILFVPLHSMILSRLRSILCILIVSFLPFASFGDDSTHTSPPGRPRLATDLTPRYYPYSDRANYPQRLLAKMNIIRQQNQLRPLLLSAPLGEVAQGHSTDMYIRNFVDHVNPDKEDHMARLQRTKPRMLVLQAKENLAWYEATFLPSEADLIDKEYEGLMNSPPHREAILSKDVGSVGFGFTTYWNGDRFESNQVQLFADVVGEWRQDIPSTIQPGQMYEITLARPVDMFLASNENPRAEFPDPFDRNKRWVGGLPVPFVQRQPPTIRMPNVGPGSYRLQCSPKDKNKYIVYKNVRVVAPN